MNRRKFLQTTLLPLALQSASSLFHSKAFAQAVRQGDAMDQPAQRIIEANNIRINIAEQGSGPLVLLCHGFPECLVFVASADSSACRSWLPCRGTRHARLRQERPTRGNRPVHHLPSGRGSRWRARRARCKKRGGGRPRRGRERGLAGRTNAPGSRPRRRRAQCPVPTARAGTADERHAADC